MTISEMMAKQLMESENHNAINQITDDDEFFEVLRAMAGYGRLLYLSQETINRIVCTVACGIGDVCEVGEDGCGDWLLQYEGETIVLENRTWGYMVTFYDDDDDIPVRAA